MELKKRSKILFVMGIIISSFLVGFWWYGFFEVPAQYSIQLEESFKSVAPVPIGAAIDPTKLQQNEQYEAIFLTHFNAMTPENHFKWSLIHPGENEYDWSKADYLVNYSKAHGMHFHGHCLVWHNQLPEWVLNFNGTREEWKAILKSHIMTVVGRYRGEIESWDVVNEAFERDSYRNTLWLEHIGEEYFADAFTWAHQADPDAKLYYNDYNLLGDLEKTQYVVSTLAKLISEGVPIHGIGIQAHITSEWPDLDTATEALHLIETLNISIRISEWDIQMNSNGRHREYTRELAELQAQRFYNLTRLFLTIKNLTGITFWGISDADSWIPHFKGHVDWPLLFDDAYKPKPAAQAFLYALEGKSFPTPVFSTRLVYNQMPQ